MLPRTTRLVNPQLDVCDNGVSGGLRHRLDRAVFRHMIDAQRRELQGHMKESRGEGDGRDSLRETPEKRCVYGRWRVVTPK
ncbi:hypothetical protein KIPB_010219, partial [Kipferlia bialata]|eukprot:g10219.t1